MNRILVGLLLLLFQDTLQVKVSLVSIGVRVTDSKGRSVSGLKAGDFSIFHEGVPQKIEFFSSEEQPITLGILLDHSSSMAANAKLDRAKEAALRLVQATHQAGDYFYVAFDDNVQLASDFTTDREKVDSAIQGTRLGEGTSLYDAIIQGLALCNKASRPRQSLVIISDGEDRHSHYSFQQVLEIVRQSEMQIYTIGYFDASDEELYRKAGKTIKLVGGGEIDNPRIVLDKLARETGGVAFFPESDAGLAKAVDEITNDIRSQYTLAFYPKPTDTDSGYHPLRVSIRGGRYTIRARRGYGTAEIPPPPDRRNDDPPYQAKIQRQNGRLFYRDDFSDNTSGWPNRENAKYTAKGYRLNGGNFVAINGPFFTDFRAAVSVSVGGGTGGGLVFRQLEAGYYVIAAYPARSASQPGVLVGQHVDSSGTRNLQQWPLMSQAGPTKNLRLEVRCQSTVCSVYEGEQFRGELKNITQLDGRIGLCVIGRGQALFTDLSAEEIR